MDVRVFPFSFPPIRGGAQGGVSPTPTPDPEPEYPYDDTNAAVVVTKSKDWNAASRATFRVVISGVVVNDVSEVSSLIIDMSDCTFNSNGSPVTLTAPMPTEPIIDVGNPNDSKSVIVSSTGVSETTASVDSGGSVYLIAYDANGVELQKIEMVIP